jgi:uncharacterized protein (DUF2141 family)
MGGAKDAAPPKLEKSTPENNSTNYKGKVVVLEFDEYVDGQKLNENIVISPLVESKYDIITKKKTVTVKFREPFKENTTYNINFGESIKDLTEGNFIKDLNIAFSTGPLIDSLSIQGQAYDFIKEKGVKDLSILVYKVGDTNTVRNSKPLYFSKTNIDGNFNIKNVKEGTYNIYALNDLNKNFNYDNEKEDIAYINNLVVNKSVTGLKLGITKADKKGASIVSDKQEHDYYLLTLSEGVEQYSLTTDHPPLLSDYEQEGKVIRIFNTFHTKDSVSFYAQFTDSSGNISKDTIKLKFEEYKDKNKKNVFLFILSPKNLEIAKGDEIKLRFNKPVDKINYSQLVFKKDSIPFTVSEEQFHLDSTKMNISFINTNTFKDSLVLRFGEGAFMSYTGDSSMATKYKLKNKNEENYGLLSGTIICRYPHYIFQLLDSKGKVVDSKINPIKFFYKALEPGQYQLKVIIDANNNGRWDPLDLDNDIQPEKIAYYKDKINLRANWEIQDIKFQVK